MMPMKQIKPMLSHALMLPVMVTVLGTLACLLAASPAPAAVWSAKACYDQAKTQHDLTVCSDQEYKQADAELNRLYKTLMATLPKLRRPLLTTAQQAWLKYRDAQCVYEADIYKGGSIQPMIRLQCLSSLTFARNVHLRAMLKDLEK